MPIPGLMPAVGAAGWIPPVTITPASSAGAPQKTGASHTFSSVNLGTDPGNGISVVAVAGLANMNNKISGCTIAGITATELFSWSQGSSTDLAIFIASGVTASTGNIVISLAGSNSNWRPHYASYRKSGGRNGTTAYATNPSNGNDTSGNLSLNVPANGAVLAAFGNDNNVRNHTWSGLTEDFENDVDNTTFSAAHGEFDTDQMPQAITVTLSGAENHSGVAVAFAD